MAKRKPNKRTKQCCECVAKNLDTKLRGQNCGYNSASYWLGNKIILIQMVLSLKSLWDHLQPLICSVV